MFNSILGVFSRQIITAILQVLIIAIVAKSYGPAINGNVVIMLMTPTVAGMVLSLGLSSSIIYYYSSNKFAISTLKSDCFFVFLFIGFISSIIVFLLIPYFFNWEYSGLTRCLVSISVFISIYSNIFTGVLIAKQLFSKLNIFTLLQPTIMFIGIVLIYFTDRQEVIYEYVSISLFFSYLISSIYLYFILTLNPKYSEEEIVKCRSERIKLILSYGMKSHVSNVVAILNYKSDIFIINYMLNPIFVGVYAIFSQISEKLWMLSNAVCSVLLPRITTMLNTEDSKAIDFIMMVSRVVLYATTMLSLCLLLISDRVVLLFFGEEYLRYTNLLYFLLPGIIASSHSKVVASYFSGIGRPELNLYSSLVSLILNLSLNLLLIPLHGIYGAAIATLISYIFNFSIKMLIFYCFTKKINLLFSLNDFYLIKSKVKRLFNV